MADMKSQPRNEHVLIRPQSKEETTASGIVLPDTMTKDRPQMGEIIAVGPGKKTPEGKVIPMDLQVGQKVYFTKYGPTEVKLNDEELLVVDEKDVLLVIE